MEDNRFVLAGPPPVIPVPQASLGQLFFESLSHNDSKKDIALVDAFTGRTISYKNILQESCNLAEALRRFGCDINTVISISSENNVDFFIPVIASVFIGSVITTVNQFYTPEELNHVFSITKPKIIFVSENLAQKFVLLKKHLIFIEQIIVFNSNKKINGTQNIKKFIEKHLGKDKIEPTNFQPWSGNTEEKTAFILYSSGTTGLPKGVTLTHRNFAVRLAQTCHPKYRESDRATLFAILPFFHGYGLCTGITSIINKNKMVVLKQFDEHVFLSAIEKHKINSLIIAPPLAVFLAKTPKLTNYDVSSVQKLVCGAAPLSKDIENTLKQRLNINVINQGYGLTEATLAIIMMENGVGRTGSCGTVITYMKIKVRCPETKKSLGPYQVGEICAKGPLVMKGYYKDEEATKNAFTTDGWLLTGDLGYYDDDGYFYIVDRLKELIKYKGYQVAPAELEAILVNHPKVLDVGVAGLPDEEKGELPVAFVAKKVEDVTEEELQNFVAGKVSPQKRLRGGVQFVSSIPKNASGKILRRELKKKLLEHKKPQPAKL